MPSTRSLVRAVEVTLAFAVLGLAVALFEVVTIPDTGLLFVVFHPVSIHLVPGALAVVALVGAAVDGRSVGSMCTGALAVLTIVMVLWSVATRLFATRGGVFFGWLFVSLSAVALAVTVLVRPLARRIADFPALGPIR